MSTVNRNELARRIAHRGYYNINDIEKILEIYEDVFVEALENGEEVKQGKVFKTYMKDLPEKRAYNGFDKTYFTREPKKAPKFKPLTRLTNIKQPTDTEEGE